MTRSSSVALLLLLAAAARAQGPPASYTLPVLDLAFETGRQIVVDREAGQYLGHPTMVLLEDGKTLLAVYPKGHGKGAVVMKRSTDGGRSWSERLPVPEDWKTSREVPTLYRIARRGGGRRLLMFSGLRPIRLTRSDDDGRTWTPLAPIGDFGGIVAMASLLVRENGELVAFFHDDGRFLEPEGKAGRFVVYQTVSRDDGLTWSDPEGVATHETAHLCEPGLVTSPDGRRHALLLRENSRKHNGFVVFTDDEGRSWSEPRELPAALTGDRHVARQAPDGRLFVSFRDTARESMTRGDWVAWVGTWDDLVRGREGQYRVRLMDNHHRWDCAYPAVELLPDGTILALTYGHWTPGEEPWIAALRLRLAELDARLPKLR